MKRKFYLFALIFTFITSSAISQTVYVTNSGSKFHKGSCRYLNKSAMSVDLSDALNHGYTACKVCKPLSSDYQDQNGYRESNSNNYYDSSSEDQYEVQCSAITKAGTRCKRMTKYSNGYCWQHGGNYIINKN
jgi:RNA polymerase subunit RPABC4/transcription elongation factor Spt4